MQNDVRFGVVLQGVDPPNVFVDLVRTIEDLGFDQLWLTDSSLHARYVYSYLTLAATVTTRLSLGTSVTNPVTRHPALGALAIATVDEISGGRAVHGIGAGDRPLEALGLRPARLASLRDAVDVTRRLLRGEHVTYQGSSFSLEDAHVRVPTRPDIPVYISASGPKTLQLAGEIADGVILLSGLFPEGIKYAKSHVRSGEERREDGQKVDVAAFAYGSLRDDRCIAIEEARPIAAWFCQTAPVYCELAGMPKETVEQVRAAYEGGEFQEARQAANLISDEMVTKLALAGTAEDGYAKVRMLVDAGIRNVNLFPLGDDRREVIRQFGTYVMPRFR
jgi:5,10-methylenetetrahydromethanopterin reductase